MAQARPTRLVRPVDMRRDHALGNPEAELTLVEYGSYTSPACHAVHEVVADLWERGETDEACKQQSDCCHPGDQCIAGFCSYVPE